MLIRHRSSIVVELRFDHVVEILEHKTHASKDAKEATLERQYLCWPRPRADYSYALPCAHTPRELSFAALIPVSNRSNSDSLLNKKGCPLQNNLLFYRGPERIRTAVQAFAELCLATRPRDRIFLISDSDP